MNEIAEHIAQIKTKIPETVQLVAVSKTKPKELIEAAYAGGQRIFGENRPLELKEKAATLPQDIQWHFIGHPQSKQVKYFAPFVSLIHGVDSLKLLEVINKEAVKNNRIIGCLLQFHIATEETKFGLNLSEAKEILDSPEFQNLQNIEIRGVMGMATFTHNEMQIQQEFRNLKHIFEQLKNTYFCQKPHFCELSMGMSKDYPIAIAEGSTMIRIGTQIFGARNYTK